MADNNDRGLHMKYFVLKPSTKDAHGRASLVALAAYEAAIAAENRQLAEDLRMWRAEVQAGFGEWKF